MTPVSPKAISTGSSARRTLSGLSVPCTARVSASRPRKAPVARKVVSCGASNPPWSSSLETVPLRAKVSAALRTMTTPRAGRAVVRLVTSVWSPREATCRPVRYRRRIVLTLGARPGVRTELVGGWVYSVPVFEYGSSVRTGEGVRGTLPTPARASRARPGRSALPATHRPPGGGQRPDRGRARGGEAPSSRPHPELRGHRGQTRGGSQMTVSTGLAELPSLTHAARVTARASARAGTAPHDPRAHAAAPQPRRAARARPARAGRGGPDRSPTACATPPPTSPRCGPRRRCSPRGPVRSPGAGTG